MKQCGMLADDEKPTSDVEDDSSSEDCPVARVDSPLDDTCVEDPAEISPSRVISVISSFNFVSPNAANDSRRSRSLSSSSSDDELVNRIDESLKQNTLQDDDNDDYSAYLSLMQSLKPDKFGF